MKRGMAGRGARGSPPLPRQRMALRILQVTFAAIAVALGAMAARAWGVDPAGKVIVLMVLSGAFAVFAGALGARTVRGPEPPKLD